MRAVTRIGSFVLCTCWVLCAGGTASAQSNSCSGAQSVGAGGTFTGTTIGATSDAGAVCSSGSTAPDVWYKFTSQCPGTLRVNTCGTADIGGPGLGIDTVLSVHTGCPGSAANMVACNDQTSACTGVGSDDSAVVLSAVPGTTYLIRVSTWQVSSPGAFILNVDFTPSAAIGSLRNGDFDNGAGWCFFDESNSGSVSYAGGSAAVTGGSAGEQNRFTYIQQTFTTYDTAAHTIGFDWSYSTTNAPTYDSARWDLIDDVTGLSLLGGPQVLSATSGGSGTVSHSFAGSGTYTLRLGTHTQDGLFAPGVSTFDDVSVGCAGPTPIGQIGNEDFSAGGSGWCFTDESESGAVDFSSGAAVVRGGNDGGDDRFSSIRQTFTTYDVASHWITFDWSYASGNAPGYDQVRWDLIDEMTGISLIGGPLVLSDTSGESGTVYVTVSSSGVYTLVLGTWTQDGVAGAGFSTFDDISIGCSSIPGPFANGDFHDPTSAPWCFSDESDSGMVSFAGSQATIWGGDDLGNDRFTYIEQTFTTQDTASHEIGFEWSFVSSDIPGNDSARWDLIDASTGLSLVAGPLTLSSTPFTSGLETRSFAGSGTYTLRLGTHTVNGCCGAGTARYDGVSVSCGNIPGHFANGDFQLLGAGPWCFTDQSVSGSVDYATGAAVVTGGNDNGDSRFTYIRQAFTTFDSASHILTFDWSYSSVDSPGFDEARWDLIDIGTGLSLISGPLTLADTSGDSGTVTHTFAGTGEYLLLLGSWTQDGIFGPGVSTFDDVTVTCNSQPDRFDNGDFSAGDRSWCFSDETDSGSATFSTGSASVTGGTAGEAGKSAMIQQTFTTHDAAVHTITFDWVFSTFDPPGADAARWDLIDESSGLSVIGGPVTLGDTNGAGGTVSQDFTGSGVYTLRFGSWTSDGAGAPGLSGYDNIGIACGGAPGIFANGSFSDPTGGPWCFTDEGDSGSVGFASGAAVVTGGDSGATAAPLHTYISQTFALPAIAHDISFSWSYTSTGAPGSDGAYWDLVDAGTGFSMVAGPLTLSDTSGMGGTASATFVGSGDYTLILGTFTLDNQFGAGVTTFDDVTIAQDECDPVGGLGCTPVGSTVHLSWTNQDAYAAIQIRRDGTLDATRSGTATSYAHTGVGPGTHSYAVTGDCGSLLSTPAGCVVTIVPPPASFRRGDVNNDAAINIADPIYLLGNLFPSGGPPAVLICLDAADGNDDDVIDIADAVVILAALFGSPTTPLPSPFPSCGIDGTPGTLRCATTICP